MIRVRIRGPTALQGVSGSIEKEYPFGKKCLWIGRGDEIVQKQNDHGSVLNMNQISKSVSRVHACLLFSPAFYRGEDYLYPSHYKKFGGIQLMPDNILLLVWEFSRPARKIVLKDMHSKTGVYKKINNVKLQTGLQVVLGDSRPLIFHHREIYDSRQEVKARLEWLKQKEYAVINDKVIDAQSFWVISFKGLNFILLDGGGRLTIGRSSSNSFVICQASISRRHATLEYSNNEWRILDGDGSSASSNGVWQRVRRVFLDYRLKSKSQYGGQSVVKLGDILFQFDIRQDYSHLNVSELCVSHKHSTTESLSSVLKREMQEVPMGTIWNGSEILFKRQNKNQ